MKVVLFIIFSQGSCIFGMAYYRSFIFFNNLQCVQISLYVYCNHILTYSKTKCVHKTKITQAPSLFDLYLYLSTSYIPSELYDKHNSLTDRHFYDRALVGYFVLNKSQDGMNKIYHYSLFQCLSAFWSAGTDGWMDKSNSKCYPLSVGA